MQILFSFIAGSIMAGGLCLSGMVNPHKVRSFLDITGHFDPTLAFVMAGALLVAAIGFRSIKGYPKPFLCESFDLPQKTKVDASLVLGAILFGAGWGLAGFCPAPAVVAAGLGLGKALIFIAAMLTGMFFTQKIFKG